MNSTPPKPSNNTKVLTNQGMPLDLSSATPNIASNDADGGPARRIGYLVPPSLICFAPQSVASPSKDEAPSFYAAANRTDDSLSLIAGPNDSSLVDDDDDQIMDYFSKANVPITTCSPLTNKKPPSSPSSTHWNVTDSDVPTLPSFYPLEKSSIFVPNASASVLASRVASALQTLSIIASYDAKNAKVDCVTESSTEFRIRLYRSDGLHFNHGIIVEVQRRAGFDLEYAQNVFAIFDAANGNIANGVTSGVMVFLRRDTYRVMIPEHLRDSRQCVESSMYILG